MKCVRTKVVDEVVHKIWYEIGTKNSGETVHAGVTRPLNLSVRNEVRNIVLGEMSEIFGAPISTWVNYL